MAKIRTYKPHSCGIALGGLGTGSVELLPDGEFHYWQIANPPRWASRCSDAKVEDGEESAGALSFYVRTVQAGGQPVLRKLGMSTSSDDFTYRMFAWNKPVESIEYDGNFPSAKLTYQDKALPVRLSMTAVAPFVPHDQQLSATPGFYLNFDLSNPTDRPLTVSLLGILEPSFANRTGGCANYLLREKDSVSVQLAPAVPSDLPDCGELCFSLESEGEHSYITADFFRYLREYVSHSQYGITQESVLFGFRQTGRLNCAEAGDPPPKIPEELDALSDEALQVLCKSWAHYPFADSLRRRVARFFPNYPSDRSEMITFLQMCGRQMRDIGEHFGSCALCSALTLAPNEQKRISFTLSWYFPNHMGAYGNRLGHYYENLFQDAAEVSAFLRQNRSRIEGEALNFSRLLYSTSLSACYADAWSSHLSTLVKCSWWLKDGKFGLWEGLGYCGFHTTDITYHASFGLLSLFPDLQKQQMLMGAAFQRSDGRVHHFFTPDLNHVDDGFDRVDMNMQFVLLVCRDFKFTGDKAYLSKLWGHICLAMDATQSLDSDGDGLPDRDTGRNTYDAWHFCGSPVYIDILWLAALRAAIYLAETLKDGERRSRWTALLEKGRESLEQLLWNGRYYNLWREGEYLDECLMTDQLDGEWYLRMMGFSGNLSDERVRSVVQTIFAHNFDSEAGLVNATCPEGTETSIYTYQNCQAGAVWTGIGYAFASLAQSVGLNDIADRIVSTIDENQFRLGMVWDHWECGPHYTRPLSSFCTMMAAAGLSVDASKKEMVLNAVCDELTIPICMPDFIARLSIHGKDCRIECLKGSLENWKVVLPSEKYDLQII